MAGDWIKVEHTMPDKPEVVTLATILNIDQDAVAGKLLRLWIWADANSVSGNDLSVTSSFLDRLTLCPGFAAGLVKVGWLSGRDGRLMIPNFDRHNGQTSKNRATTNRRVSDFRKRDGNENVTEQPLQKPLPEKRREEKRTTSKEVVRKAKPESCQEVEDYCASLGLPKNDGAWFWDKKEANGWKNGTSPIKDWKAVIRTWKQEMFFPSQKAKASNGGGVWRP